MTPNNIPTMLFVSYCSGGVQVTVTGLAIHISMTPFISWSYMCDPHFSIGINDVSFVFLNLYISQGPHSHSDHLNTLRAKDEEFLLFWT